MTIGWPCWNCNSETGAVYQYSLVPQQVYRDLLRAESKGRFFNQNIRGKFPYQRIQEVPSRIRH